MIMVIIITVITGILLGLAASARTPTDGFEDLTRNVVVGIVGAFIGVRVAEAIKSSGEAGTSTIALIIAAIAGAMLLLFTVNRIRRA